MSQALADAFASLQQRYKPGVLEAPLTIYFSLGDEPGQKWSAVLTPESCLIQPGKTEGADLLLKTSEELFLKLLRREWTPGVMDFMSGRFKSNDPMRLGVLKDCFTS